MAAELFSTSLPHSGEVEVKKSFIQLNQLEPPAGNQDQRDGSDVGGARPEFGSGERDERDGWKEVQPTLRERSAAEVNRLLRRCHMLVKVLLLKPADVVFAQKCSHVQQRADVRRPLHCRTSRRNSESTCS